MTFLEILLVILLLIPIALFSVSLIINLINSLRKEKKTKKEIGRQKSIEKKESEAEWYEKRNIPYNRRP